MQRNRLSALFAILAAAVLFVSACSGPAQIEIHDSEAPDASQPAERPEQTPSAEATSDAALVSGTEAYTAYADYTPEPQSPPEVVPGTNPSILVAYFSHSGNGAAADGLDAATSATALSDADSTGAAQQVALWIAEQTGGDLYPIRTAYTYPEDRTSLVQVGEGQDTDGIMPELAGYPASLAAYDSVFLVYPIWHFGLPAPVRSFLAGMDLSGKNVYAFATNEGSSFGSSLETIREMEPGADVIEGVSVPRRDVAGAKGQIEDAVRALLEQPQSSAGTEDVRNMQVVIGERSFGAELADTQAAQEFAELLQVGPVTVSLRDYGSFEKVGGLGHSLTTSDAQMEAQPGDIMLYTGNQVVLFYGTNSWAYTPLGRIIDLDGWADALGSGEVTAVFRLSEN